MFEDMRLNPEFDEDVSNQNYMEDSIARSINLDRKKFSLKSEYINFDDIWFAEPTKTARKDTYLGLLTSVKELGIVTPIHVMMTESYIEHLEEYGDTDFDGNKYIVLDGFRRVYAGVKAGIKGCQAIIWQFKDTDVGAELLVPLSCIINKTQGRSYGEIWYLYKVLESGTYLTPNMLEYLLQLAPGDSMKLKDIMTSDYPEIRDDLLSNKKNITQAYNALQKARKDEDQLLKEDKLGISNVEQGKEIANKANVDENGERRGSLSDEEVKELLDLADNDLDDLSEEDFDEFAGNNIESERFDVNGDRHLDPQLRAAVLQRDGYKCRVSGFGEGLPTEVALGVLQIHHLVPVADGGTNDVDNLITIEQSAHTLLHILQRRGGKLNMKKEDFDKLPEHRKQYFKNLMRFVKIAVEADKKCGKTLKQVKKDTSEAIKYKMPGTDLKENMEALKYN